MSNTETSDVLEDIVADNASITDSGDSSTPEYENTDTTESVETQDITGEAEEQAEGVESGDQERSNESPVKEPEKPQVGDMVPRTRLNEEIFKKKKVIEENAELKRENAELRANQQSDTTQQTQNHTAFQASSQPAPYPVEGDDQDAKDGFDPAKLSARRAQWQSNEVTRQLDERELKSKQAAQQKQFKETQQGFNNRLREYAEKNPDYLEDYKAAGDPVYPNHITDALIDSETGPAIDHALLKDDALRDRILGLPERKALVEIGKLEIQLTNVKPKQKPKQRQTRAPAPIETSRGSSAKGADFMDGYIIE
jgi:hypothetical protein